jgi:hypothetical protein
LVFATGYPIRIFMSAACILASVRIGELSVLGWFALVLFCYTIWSVRLSVSKKVGAGRKVADLDDSPLSWFPLLFPLSICWTWIDLATDLFCNLGRSSEKFVTLDSMCNYIPLIGVYQLVMSTMQQQSS